MLIIIIIIIEITSNINKQTHDITHYTNIHLFYIYLSHRPISSVIYNICAKIDDDHSLKSSSANSMNTNGRSSSSSSIVVEVEVVVVVYYK